MSASRIAVGFELIRTRLRRQVECKRSGGTIYTLETFVMPEDVDHEFGDRNACNGIVQLCPESSHHPESFQKLIREIPRFLDISSSSKMYCLATDYPAYRYV